jgi:hypothetical protein
LHSCRLAILHGGRIRPMTFGVMASHCPIEVQPA